MASLRDVRRKIVTVKNTRKITTAMKMVAAAKLRRAQAQVDSARPYAQKMRQLVGRVAPLAPEEIVAKHRLLQTRVSPRVGLVVLTSNRGMCGAYNNNIVREALNFIEQQKVDGREVEVISIGTHGTTGLKVRKVALSESYPMLDVGAPYEQVRVLLRAIVSMYDRDESPVSEVYVAYARFKNAVTQVPCVERFLPIEADDVPSEEQAEGSAIQLDFEFSPNPEGLLDVLLPKYVDNQVYQYLLEAAASENGARMTAMSTASDNADELIDALTLQYNRARQDAITRELIDIVGGASALSED